MGYNYSRVVPICTVPLELGSLAGLAHVREFAAVSKKQHLDRFSPFAGLTLLPTSKSDCYIMVFNGPDHHSLSNSMFPYVVFILVFCFSIKSLKLATRLLFSAN